jgi:hypothetical protein
MSGAAKYQNRGRAGSEVPPDERQPLKQVPERAERPAGEVHASPMREESDNTVQETPTARHARLKVLIIKKKQQEEIEAMEEELAGEKPAFFVDLTGETPAKGHKRAALSTVKIQPFRSAFNRPKTPPYFKGKDITELDKFDIAFKAYFKAGGLYTAPK